MRNINILISTCHFVYDGQTERRILEHKDCRAQEGCLEIDHNFKVARHIPINNHQMNLSYVRAIEHKKALTRDCSMEQGCQQNDFNP